MLSNNSESIEKSGMKTVANENGALASLYGRIDIDSSPSSARPAYRPFARATSEDSEH